MYVCVCLCVGVCVLCVCVLCLFVTKSQSQTRSVCHVLSSPVLKLPFIVQCSVCSTRAAEVLASGGASSPTPTVTGPHFSLTKSRDGVPFLWFGMRHPAAGAPWEMSHLVA